MSSAVKCNININLAVMLLKKTPNIIVKLGHLHDEYFATLSKSYLLIFYLNKVLNTGLLLIVELFSQCGVRAFA